MKKTNSLDGPSRWVGGKGQWSRQLPPRPRLNVSIFLTQGQEFPVGQGPEFPVGQRPEFPVGQGAVCFHPPPTSLVPKLPDLTGRSTAHEAQDRDWSGRRDPLTQEPGATGEKTS